MQNMKQYRAIIYVCTFLLGPSTIDSLLCGSVGMDGGHETLLDAKLVIDDLGQGSEAVGGAGGIAAQREE